MEYTQLILALCMGISLSAACGFRIFVPLLAVAVGVRLCGLSVGGPLAWVGSDAALICLTVATVVEILAYYIPIVDHALDVVNGPLALAAGAIITCGLLPEMPEYARWGIGIVAGSGAAGAVQLSTTALRGASAATTGTLGNPIVSTAENILSVIGSILAVLLPVAALVCLLLLVWLLYRLVRRLRRKSHPATT